MTGILFILGVVGLTAIGLVLAKVKELHDWGYSWCYSWVCSFLKVLGGL